MMAKGRAPPGLLFFRGFGSPDAFFESDGRSALNGNALQAFYTGIQHHLNFSR
jgi:hypothetical protein